MGRETIKILTLAQSELRYVFISILFARDCFNDIVSEKFKNILNFTTNIVKILNLQVRKNENIFMIFSFLSCAQKKRFVEKSKTSVGNH